MRLKVILFLSVIVALVVSIMIFLNSPSVDFSFARSMVLNYRYLEENIEVTVTHQPAITEIASIIDGRPHKDNPSCGFSADISITFESDSKKVIVCPALDGCPIVKIGDGTKYLSISEDARIELNKILEKYGFSFPCV